MSNICLKFEASILIFLRRGTFSLELEDFSEKIEDCPEKLEDFSEKYRVVLRNKIVKICCCIIKFLLMSDIYCLI